MCSKRLMDLTPLLRRLRIQEDTSKYLECTRSNHISADTRANVISQACRSVVASTFWLDLCSLELVIVGPKTNAVMEYPGDAGFHVGMAFISGRFQVPLALVPSKGGFGGGHYDGDLLPGGVARINSRKGRGVGGAGACASGVFHQLLSSPLQPTRALGCVNCYHCVHCK